MGLTKNKNTFFKGKWMDHGKSFGRQLKTAVVSYILLPWLSLLLRSVKYEQEKMV